MKDEMGDGSGRAHAGGEEIASPLGGRFREGWVHSAVGGGLDSCRHWKKDGFARPSKRILVISAPVTRKTRTMSFSFEIEFESGFLLPTETELGKFCNC
ncbi:hypothetical protein L484_004536 [Morus notabilis]|uniref:Uncharacterized protein n=1 Tax=Morus notabilis TaxID=981085 RepID=W9S2T0_9ROSA|nr:hypothetical protein L484_004536 [Morus notabilis]